MHKRTGWFVFSQELHPTQQNSVVSFCQSLCDLVLSIIVITLWWTLVRRLGKNAVLWLILANIGYSYRYSDK